MSYLFILLFHRHIFLSPHVRKISLQGTQRRNRLIRSSVLQTIQWRFSCPFYKRHGYIMQGLMDVDVIFCRQIQERSRAFGCFFKVETTCNNIMFDCFPHTKPHDNSVAFLLFTFLQVNKQYGGISSSSNATPNVFLWKLALLRFPSVRIRVKRQFANFICLDMPRTRCFVFK